MAFLLLLGALQGWGVLGGAAGPAESAAQRSAAAAFDHDHSAWDALLQRYVRDGVVDYGGLASSGRGDLDGYLGTLELGRDHRDWAREQRLAYWINAYNAYTVGLILDRYPVKSIRSIGLLPGAAFRDRFIPLGDAQATKRSLNDIEHEILRKQFEEPRIHFAIVCASKSCPSLRAEAYRSRDLQSQLEDAARTFVRDPSKNRFDAVSRTLYLSSIFRWFHEDFERAAGTLPAFFAQNADESTARVLGSGGDVRVKFLDYDWSLNGS